MNQEPPRIIVITGPTATGKSRIALAVARAFRDRGLPACIISADSVQVYRGMDIGTDKLPPEQRQGVPHYLLDMVDPDQNFSAADFTREADRVIEQMAAEGGVAVVAGGTGFYVRALLYGLFPGPPAQSEVRARLRKIAEEQGLEVLYRRLKEVDPESARRIHPHDPVRIIRGLEVYETTGEPLSSHFARHHRALRYSTLMIGLHVERKELYERINTRVSQMLARGLVAEVQRLRDQGYGPELKSQQALGYKQIHQVLAGKLDLASAEKIIQRETRHYARRQLTWLRAEPVLKWRPAEARQEIIEECLKFFEEKT